MRSDIPRQYVNERDAAQYLSVSVAFLRKTRHYGSLPGRPCPPFIRIGRTVRYSLADLDSFMAKHRVRL